MASMQDLAVKYARGFGGVIPVATWTWEKDGHTYIKPKHPLIKKWQSEPLRKEKEIRETWQKYEHYHRTVNIAVPTGQISGGYIVIDLDRKPEQGVDGYDVLLDWQRKTGRELPESWRAISGGGGYHFYYHTDLPMRCYSNYEIGVDLRADGGYIICPPSFHESGNQYQWEIAPRDMQCAEADEAVMEFIRYCRPAGYQYQRPSTARGQGGERKMILPDGLGEGGRTNALISLIGMMNRAGCLDETIKAAVYAENDKFNPPLSDNEMKKTVEPAIYRFEKGVSEDAWKNKDDWIREQRFKERTERAARNPAFYHLME